MIASYRLDASERRYRLEKANLRAMNGGELVNWLLHGQELVDTMAAPYAPDVVGLLKDDTSYGVAGDHGGHQARGPGDPDRVRRRRASDRATRASRCARSTSCPTILREMRIRAERGMDGRAVALDHR